LLLHVPLLRGTSHMSEAKHSRCHWHRCVTSSHAAPLAVTNMGVNKR
jgi:hypothetical protein